MGQPRGPVSEARAGVESVLQGGDAKCSREDSMIEKQPFSTDTQN